LGNAVETASVEASDRKRHGVAKIDTAIRTWQEEQAVGYLSHCVHT
jgi:hypothetical protein